MHKYNGFCCVVDGLDGIGKGTIIDSLKEHFVKQGKKIFSLDDYHKKNQSSYPDLKDLVQYDVFFSSQPTYNLVGSIIRERLINKKYSSSFSVSTVAEAYSLDRRIYLELFEIPLLKEGKVIIRSRGIASSLVYQPIQAIERNEHDVSINYILSLEGNRFELENSPNLLIIPTIKNPEELISRLNQREKKDDAIFETIDFQLKFKPEYESDWLKEQFESRNTIVDYLDAGVSIEHTKNEAIRIFNNTYLNH